MGRKDRVEELVSAGGLVYRVVGDGIEVVVCSRKSPPIRALPKGTPDPGESRTQTALREVREETGLEVRSEGFIDSIEYWFVGDGSGVRFHKTVGFYLMSSIGGDITLHDHEFDAVRWVPVGQALRTLTYGNEVRIVEKGLSMATKKTQGG